MPPMNRLEPHTQHYLSDQEALPQPKRSQDELSTSSGERFTAGAGRWNIVLDQSAAIFMPMHYERNYSYPLIIWLHGPGDDENQLKRIMPLVSMRNFVAVGPRGPALTSSLESRPLRYGWTAGNGHLLCCEQRVFQALELARNKANIALDRVFLAGFDSGGTVAMQVALNNPTRFAGVLSLGGPFPRGRSALKRLAEARNLPVFLTSGRESEGYHEDHVCDDLRLLHSAGMAVALRLYPCGQELTTTMLEDMNRWIMEIVTAPTSSPASAKR
jgi:phospholipase/carboxylesterase